MDPTLIIKGVIIAGNALADIQAKIEAKEMNPEHLSGNVLRLFQRLREAYNSKDSEGLTKVFAESYSGSLYDCSTRKDLLDIFEDLFTQLPVYVRPNLKIIVHQIDSFTDDQFLGVIEFEAKMKTLGFPIGRGIDSGLIECTAAPVGSNSRWKITALSPTDWT